MIAAPNTTAHGARTVGLPGVRHEDSADAKKCRVIRTTDCAIANSFVKEISPFLRYLWQPCCMFASSQHYFHSHHMVKSALKVERRMSIVYVFVPKEREVSRLSCLTDHRRRLIARIDPQQRGVLNSRLASIVAKKRRQVYEGGGVGAADRVHIGVYLQKMPWCERERRTFC